jgi:hypothetical protein
MVRVIGLHTTTVSYDVCDANDDYDYDRNGHVDDGSDDGVHDYTEDDDK